MRLIFAALFALVASAASAQMPTGSFCDPSSDPACMRSIPRPSDKTIEAARRADALKPPKPPKIHTLKPPDEPHLPWWAYFIPVAPLPPIDLTPYQWQPLQHYPTPSKSSWYCLTSTTGTLVSTFCQ